MILHTQFTSVTAVAARLGAVALVVVSLSACVIAPLGYGHHGRGHGGRLAAEASPVVVAPAPAVVVMPPAPRNGYPRHYRY
jgi:hypothetical protein